MNTYRISDAATTLGVSAQTIRNYIAIGAEYFSETATRPTRKRFTDGDLAQLQTIKDLLDEGFQYVDIPDRLTPAPRIVEPGQRNQETQEPEEQPQEPTSAIERQYQQLIASQQMGHEKEVTALNRFIDHLQGENDRLRHEVEHSRRPWYRRIFGGNVKDQTPND